MYSPFLRLAVSALAAMLLALPPAAVRAAEFPSAQSDYLIDIWQSDDELPQNSVIAMAQTTDGFLWLSTFAGIARFDGKRFEVFDGDQSPELSGEIFTTLRADAAGNLWLRDRDNRLFMRHDGRFRQLGPSDGLPGVATVLEAARDGTIWIGDPKGRLLKWDGSRFNVAQKTPPAPDWGPYYSLELDAKGDPWVCSRGRLARLVEGKWLAMLDNSDGAEFGLLRLLRDGTLALARGGRQGKLLRCAPDGISEVDTIPGEVRSYFMAEDPDGNLWISSGNGLLRREPNGRWSELTRAKGLPADPVRSELLDREGNRWFGTAGGGLVRLKRRGVQAFGTPEGMSQKVALSVAVDKPNSAWVAVLVGGLNHFDGARFSQATAPGDLDPNAPVWCVLTAADGGIWFGTYSGALFRLDAAGGPLRRFDSQSHPGMIGGPIKALFQSRAGDLWIGGDGGLARYSKGQFRSFRSTNGLADNIVSSIAEDADGAIWVGTRLGLNRIMGKSIATFTQADGMAGNSVQALFRDSEESLWIGGRNLTRLKQGKFSAVTAHEGLPVKNIRAMAEDDLGYLWFATAHGIMRASLGQLNACCDTNQGLAEFLTFSKLDGLPANECSGSQPAISKGPDGRLWFATVNGLGIIDPKHLPENNVPPPVVIEAIIVDGKPLALPQGQTNASVSIPAGTLRLEFHFAALSFTAPEKNRFRYRLENYDTDWSRPGTGEVATYTRLAPGDYRFQVLACNNGGVWNELGVSLPVTLQPFFWQAGWFRALLTLMMFGLIYWAFRSRLRQAERRRLAQEAFARQLIETQEAERQRIARELHDGVGQSLILAKNHIVSTLSQAEPASPIVARLMQVSSEVSQALEEIRATSRALRPVELDRLGVAKSLEAMIERIGGGTAMKILADLDDLGQPVDRETEIQLYRIAQEAINNVLKHSKARRVIIELKRKPGAVRLMIQDNGVGFDSSRSRRRGFGLASMAERARLIGGSLSVRAAAGRGCRLTVTVPLAQQHHE